MFFVLVLNSLAIEFIPYNAKNAKEEEIPVKCFISGENTATIGTNSTEPSINTTEPMRLTFPSTVSYNNINYTVTEIGSYAFKNCKFIEFDFDGYIKIGEHAFEGVEKLESIKISSKCKQISKYAFYKSSVQNIHFNSDLEVIENYAFSESELKLLFNLETTKVKVLGKSAFYNTKIISVAMPEHLDSISSTTFGRCLYLETVIFNPDLKEIGEKSFSGCINLKEVDLTETNVTSINTMVFSYCQNLESVKLNERTEYIGEEAFATSGLKNISIPSTVKSIGEKAFTLSQLESISFEDSLITHLNTSLFEGSKMKSVVLPKGLIEVGTKSFKKTPLEKVVFPPTLQRICHGGFSECEVLESVDLTNTKTEIIEKYAFYSTKSLKEFKCSPILKQIDSFAFKGSNISNINFPASLTKIEAGAFELSNLMSLDLSPTQVKVIPKDCFNSSLLTNGVKLGSVVEIDENAFAFTNMKEIEFPATVLNVSARAFEHCKSLEVVDMSKSKIIEIGEYAFNQISTLTVLKLPSISYEIRSSAFSYTGLKTLKINSNCIAIDKNAFSFSSLIEVDMSTASIEKLNDGVFLECSSLTKIALPDTLSKIGKEAFPKSVKEVYYCGSKKFNSEYDLTKVVNVPKNYSGSSFGSASVNKIADFPYEIDYHQNHKPKSSWATILIIIIVIIAVFALIVYIVGKYRQSKKLQDDGYLISQEKSFDTTKNLFT